MKTDNTSKKAITESKPKPFVKMRNTESVRKLMEMAKDKARSESDTKVLKIALTSYISSN